MLEELWQSSAGILRGTPKKVMYLPLAAMVERIEAFMANHPCEHDSLKPLIVEYLLEKTALIRPMGGRRRIVPISRPVDGAPGECDVCAGL